MPNLQTFRQNADSGNLESGQSLEDEQRLVLLRFNPGFSRGPLTEVHEPANLIAKFREHAIVIVCHSCFTIRIILYRIMILSSQVLRRISPWERKIKAMLCPSCEIVLGEWDSLEAGDRELNVFAKVLKQVELEEESTKWTEHVIFCPCKDSYQQSFFCFVP
jgi:hypothetical protein